MTSTKPRGIRNNNPLNILHNSKNCWQGRVTPQDDPKFVQFSTMYYGMRAAFIIMFRYMQRDPHCTIAQLITQWAPPTENSTQNYINYVCKRTKLKPAYQLRWLRKADWVAIGLAMAYAENGQEIDAADVTIGLDLAAGQLGLSLHI